MGQIEDHNQSQKSADDILRCGWHSVIFLWSMASIYHIIGYIWLFPHNIPDVPHYILHYNISQLVNWAVNYEWTIGCLLWPTVWTIPRVNTIKPNSLWEKSGTFVSLIKDNDILSSNTPLAITLCTDVRPKHLWTVSMPQCRALWLVSTVTVQEVKV